MKRLMIAAMVLATACATPEPFTADARRVPTGSFDFNEAVARSAREQLLLNIVRLRYRDPINFLEVSSVVTQYSAARDVSAGTVIGLDSGPLDEVLGVDGGVSFEEAPTISYAPLQGPDYARRMLTPVSSETLILLSQSGWSAERLMLCCVDAFAGVPNARSAAGPTPEVLPDNRAFRSLAGELRVLQQEGALTVELINGENGPRAKMVAHGSGPDADRARAFLQRLGAAPGSDSVRITDAFAAAGSGEITVRGRAMLGILSAMSHAVDAPAEHVAAGYVTQSVPSGGASSWSDVLGGYFRVQTSARRPDDAFVAVYYRDNWFYIADDQLNSKSTFDLVGHLFALQAGDGAGASPLLTLSAR